MVTLEGHIDDAERFVSALATPSENMNNTAVNLRELGMRKTPDLSTNYREGLST